MWLSSEYCIALLTNVWPAPNKAMDGIQEVSTPKPESEH